MILNTEHYYRETADLDKYKKYLIDKTKKTTSYDYLYRLKKILLDEGEDICLLKERINNNNQDLSALIMYLKYIREECNEYVCMYVLELLSVPVLSEKEYFSIIEYQSRNKYMIMFKTLTCLLHRYNFELSNYSNKSKKYIRDLILDDLSKDMILYYEENLLKYSFRGKYFPTDIDKTYFYYRLIYSCSKKVLNRELSIKEICNSYLLAPYVKNNSI